MNPETIDKFDEISRMLLQYIGEYRKVWAEEVVFTWQWWLMASTAISPWVFWLFFRKKDSTARFLFASLFIIIISLMMDILGASFGFLIFIPIYLSADWMSKRRSFNRVEE